MTLPTRSARISGDWSKRKKRPFARLRKTRKPPCAPPQKRKRRKPPSAPLPKRQPGNQNLLRLLPRLCHLRRNGWPRLAPRKNLLCLRRSRWCPAGCLPRGDPAGERLCRPAQQVARPAARRRGRRWGMWQGSSPAQILRSPPDRFRASLFTSVSPRPSPAADASSILSAGLMRGSAA